MSEAATLRAADAADLDTLHELRRAFYRETASPWDEDAARAALAALLAEPAFGQAWVLDTAEGAVGYAVMTIGYSLEFVGRDAFVDELYLAPAARGRGLGRVALAVMEAAARARGVRALHLEVDPDNARAVALYRRWGFADHGRRLFTRWLDPAAAPSRSRDRG